MDYTPAGKACFGAYQPSQLCDHCWAAELCKQETIRLDGYYDKQAEGRLWWEDIENTVGDALYLAATR